MEYKKGYREEVSDDDYYSDREDMTIERVGETLDAYEVLVFNIFEEKVKILQDQNVRRHKSFEDTQKGSPQSSTPERSSNPSTPKGVNSKKNNKESTSNILSKSKSAKKRGPRATKFATKCKSRSQVRYKRRNGIIKAMRDLKVVTDDDTLACFFRHPLDGGTAESVLYATTIDLIKKFKSFGISQKVSNISEPQLQTDDVLQVLTPSKEIKNLKKKKQKGVNNGNYCRLCQVKYDTKLDNDFDFPWFGYQNKKYDYWVHVYCLGFLTNDAESMTEWYCRKHHLIKMPSHKRVVKKI